jgi:hypothetical protein
VGSAAPSAENSEVEELGRGADDVPSDVVKRVDVRLDTRTGGAEAEEASKDEDEAAVEVSGTVDASGMGDEDGGGGGTGEEPSDAVSAELLSGGATLADGRGVLDGAGETLLGPGITMEEDGSGGGTELLVGGGWLLGGGTALEEG